MGSEVSTSKNQGWAEGFRASNYRADGRDSAPATLVTAQERPRTQGGLGPGWAEQQQPQGHQLCISATDTTSPMPRKHSSQFILGGPQTAALQLAQRTAGQSAAQAPSCPRGVTGMLCPLRHRGRKSMKGGAGSPPQTAVVGGAGSKGRGLVTCSHFLANGPHPSSSLGASIVSVCW